VASHLKQIETSFLRENLAVVGKIAQVVKVIGYIKSCKSAESIISSVSTAKLNWNLYGY